MSRQDGYGPFEAFASREHARRSCASGCAVRRKQAQPQEALGRCSRTRPIGLSHHRHHRRQTDACGGDDHQDECCARREEASSRPPSVASFFLRKQRGGGGGGEWGAHRGWNHRASTLAMSSDNPLTASISLDQRGRREGGSGQGENGKACVVRVWVWVWVWCVGVGEGTQGHILLTPQSCCLGAVVWVDPMHSPLRRYTEATLRWKWKISSGRIFVSNPSHALMGLLIIVSPTRQTCLVLFDPC